MGSPEPLDSVAVRLYDELRRLARARVQGLPPGQTIQPTALVNEVYMRLRAEGDKPWENETAFFAAAAEAMRRVLVDHARRKHALKRGGGRSREDETALCAGALSLAASPERVLDMNDALAALDADDPDLSTIVILRVFVGLTTEEIGAVLDVSRKTIERRWRYAAAVLRSRLGDDPAPAEGPP